MQERRTSVALRSTPVLELSTPLRFVKRIGDRVAAELARKQIHTVEDLLYHLPFRYEDRLHPQPIAELTPGAMASVIGEVRGTTLLRSSRMPLFEMTVGQGASSIKAMWFNGTYLKDRFPLGATVALYGQIEASRSTAGRLKMLQPQFELLPAPGSADEKYVALEVGRIVPVYETLGGTTAWGARLTSRWLRRILWQLFEDLNNAIATVEQGEEVSSRPGQSAVERPAIAPAHLQSDPAHNLSSRLERSAGERPAFSPAQAIPDTLPLPLLARLNLPPRLAALRDVHFPPPGTPMLDLIASTTPAHRRLIFEEFFYLELGLELKRRRMRERIGTTFVTDANVRRALKQVLPFHPTAAQKRALAEIAGDMRSPQPMRRLVQGDVGSGKTIVAMQAALIAIENGYQVALMAPTEILATQHFLSARKLLAGRVSPRTGQPYRVTLLTGSLDQRSKSNARHRLATGETNLAIGTHALIEDKVEFANLGLVIVDEQHRFGVQQRFRLMRKPGPDGIAHEPDTLVMTATPIPRTLALTLYGDLDVSVIDELPPGRTPITTRRTSHQRSDDVWAFVRKQVAAGRQAYVVYPIIEGANDDQAELDFAPAEDDEPGHSRETTPSSSATPAKATRQAPAPQKEAASHSAPDPVAARLVASVRDRRGAKRPDQNAPKPPLGTPKASSNTPKRAGKPRPSLFPQAKLRAAADSFDELRTGPLAGLRLGLLHGRLSAAEKDATMQQFSRGEIDVLIATTVIEVGVDVPNATLMVIEHADRFGLSQLHQLRGRVGRGKQKSYCLLVTGDRVSAAADTRLDAMVSTTDGFALAEIDLEQRGPGEFFGTRQAGAPELRVANLLRDRALLELARAEAATFAAAPDPSLTLAEIEAVWTRLRETWQRRYGLIEA